MVIKRHKPEEIVTKLRQVEVLCGQWMPRIDAIRQVQIAEQTFYRWRKQYGDMDLSRFCAALSARLSHLPFKSDRAFPA